MTCCLSSRDGKGLGIREEQDTTSCCLIPNWSLRKPADLTVASEITELLSLVASSPDLKILSEMSVESETPAGYIHQVFPYPNTLLSKKKDYF